MKSLIVLTALFYTIVVIEATRYRILISRPLLNRGIEQVNNTNREFIQTFKYLVRSRPVSKSQTTESRVQESKRVECKEYKNNCLSECLYLDDNIEKECTQQCQNKHRGC